MATHYDPAVKAHALRLIASGLPVREVAESLDVPQGTVASWKYRARDRGELPSLVPATGNLTEDPAVPVEVAIRMRELEARLETLEANQAFLGKVSAFFAKQRQP